MRVDDYEDRTIKLAHVVGGRLRFALRASDLTCAADLARVAGVSRSAASLWLSGTRLPSTVALVAVSSALHVSCDWILGGDVGPARNRASPQLQTPQGRSREGAESI